MNFGHLVGVNNKVVPGNDIQLPEKVADMDRSYHSRNSYNPCNRQFEYKVQDIRLPSNIDIELQTNDTFFRSFCGCFYKR